MLGRDRFWSYPSPKTYGQSMILIRWQEASFVCQEYPIFVNPNGSGSLGPEYVLHRSRTVLRTNIAIDVECAARVYRPVQKVHSLAKRTLSIKVQVGTTGPCETERGMPSAGTQGVR